MNHPWQEALTKTASDVTGKKRVGHWRKLGPGARGTGQGGEETSGKTWVEGPVRTPESVAGKPPVAPKEAPRTSREPSPGMVLPPKKHQKDYVEHARQNKGTIAAHGTGTGKTYSAIASFEQLRSEGLVHRAIVLTPAGLRDNFAKKGVEKFTKSKAIVLTSPTQAIPDDAVYVILSHALFRANPEAFMAAVNPDAMIVDEFHRASNPKSKLHQSIKKVRPQVDRFTGLTASPSQNRMEEIAPLIELASGKLDENAPVGSKKGFRKKYVKRIEVPNEKSLFASGRKKDVLVNREQLVKQMGPVVHYVEDLDASEKPPKYVETVETEMSPQQQKLYEMAMSGIDPQVRLKIQRGEEVGQKEAMFLFTAILRARQASNSLHTVVPGMTPLEAAKATPKVQNILADLQTHLKETPDGKVIITTNMVRGGVDVLSAALTDAGVPFGVFAGQGVQGMTEKKRQQDAEDYAAGKTRVIIITGAGAEGLSFGNTTMVQAMDGHFNPERINQIEARGVRAGGQEHRPVEKRKVIVKRYVSTIPKSFWQKILFQPPTQSTDQWMYQVAGKKGEGNRELRDVLARRSQHETKKRDSFAYRLFRGGRP